MHTWIISILLAGAIVHGETSAEERERIGRAYDRSSGALLYEERHLETFAGGKLVADRVRYVDPQGHIFGSKRVDFRDDPYVPEFQLDNERTGHIEALRRVDTGGIEVRFRERADKELRQVRLAAPRGAVADAGFDRFIEAHWDELSRGVAVVRQFLVPSRLEFMDWRIQRADNDDADTDRGTIAFSLEIDSAFLRIVVPSISVIYDRDTRRLLRYEGLSNLRDASGDNHSVRIEFAYAARNARRPDPERIKRFRLIEPSATSGAHSYLAPAPATRALLSVLAHRKG